MQRLQLLFHRLGLGDVLTCAPMILLALDHQYSVDVVYETGAAPEVIAFFAATPLGEQPVRFVLRGAQPRAVAGDAAVLYSHRILADVWKCAPGAEVLCVPLPEHRRSRIALYNRAVVPALRLRGLRAREMRANRGRSIGRMMFEDFAAHLGAMADYDAFVPRVRALLPAPGPETPRNILAHLFRDHPLRRLEEATLARAAACLAGAVSSSRAELAVLFHAASSFERHAAEYFAERASAKGLRCRLLASPRLEEAARLVAAAPLYAGVDHGISQLAGLMSARCFLLYGGYRNHSDVHRTWQPVMEAEPVEQTPHVSLMRRRDRAVAMVHPARAEYLAHRKEDSALINRAATRENLEAALSLLGFRPG